MVLEKRYTRHNYPSMHHPVFRPLSDIYPNRTVLYNAHIWEEFKKLHVMIQIMYLREKETKSRWTGETVKMSVYLALIGLWRVV